MYYDQRRRLYILRAFGLAMAALVLMTTPVWPEDSIAQKAIKSAGAVLVIGAVLGRLWSMLYIGGRKNVTLMTKGPYSITRNPLYFFSTVGSIGVGLSFGSLALGAIVGITVGAVLYATSRGEAALLHARFGDSYQRYAERVPLFLPRPGIYEEMAETTFHPQVLKRAFGDAIIFLLVIPFAEIVCLLRKSGLLPQLIALL